MLRTNTSLRRQALLKKFDNTCQSCGIKDVPLEVDHILPLSDGGSDEINNIAILCSDCHQLLDTFQPREVEFEFFLQDILNANPDYINVVVGKKFDGLLQADLTTTRILKERNQSMVIETKSGSFLRHKQIEHTIAQINRFQNLAPFDAAALAFPGRISKEDQKALEEANIEVWDLNYVAKSFSKEIQDLPSSRLKLLYSLVINSDVIKVLDPNLVRLHNCIPGKRDWVEYQKLIKDIFEFLFTPPLGRPKWESSNLSNTNRCDIIFPNHAYEGFWKFLRERYSADFIVIDTKNYTNEITKEEVLQVANYLKPHGPGMFAIIACRNGGNNGCVTTLREQWETYNKLIILLNDNDVEAMLGAKSSRGKPEEVIAEVIEEFRLSF